STLPASWGDAAGRGGAVPVGPAGSAGSVCGKFPAAAATNVVARGRGGRGASPETTGESDGPRGRLAHPIPLDRLHAHAARDAGGGGSEGGAGVAPAHPGGGGFPPVRQRFLKAGVPGGPGAGGGGGRPPPPGGRGVHAGGAPPLHAPPPAAPAVPPASRDP